MDGQDKKARRFWVCFPPTLMAALTILNIYLPRGPWTPWVVAAILLVLAAAVLARTYFLSEWPFKSRRKPSPGA
ncbi:hypothetical protein GCM10012275_32100 [Longimycelium tulufanense]|uniref:Uncharacterized protein n=1 Tax=Longimycelium tulufanense TaxID=907463 RepID=A0A8J3CCE6_9PSEU|nr:hypothetical protein GCM10012275_32100 [Longimycelium tulufanense]